MQRVRRASICVEGEVVGQMGSGLLALVGVARSDTASDAIALAEKLVHLRVLPDEEGRMNRSPLETGATLGIVSQFTLLGDARKGRRPSWNDAAPPEQAEPLVEQVCDCARRLGVRVVPGRFRAQMEIELVNDGPVTILLDTARVF